MAQSTQSAVWSVKDVNTLINVVKHTSYIYDTKDKKHSNQNEIDKGWQIINNFIESKTATDCKLKWKQLTTQFQQIEHNRLCSNKTPTWMHYDRMSFMIPFVNLESINEKPVVSTTETLSQTCTSPTIKKPRFSKEKIDDTRQDTSEPSIDRLIAASPSSINSSDMNLSCNNKNDFFFKMLSEEMKKLTEIEQSRFRIFIMTKLHEMIYVNRNAV